MTDERGGFYSAEDADSEGEEGKFYTWTPEQVDQVLGEDDGRRYCDVYRFEAEGNFADEASGAPSGLNIPHRADDLPDQAVAACSWQGRQVFCDTKARPSLPVPATGPGFAPPCGTGSAATTCGTGSAAGVGAWAQPPYRAAISTAKSSLKQFISHPPLLIRTNA